MVGGGQISQDWEPVVIRKKAPTVAAKKDEKAVNVARRSSAEIETVKKSNAGSNKAASNSTSLNTRKLDEETENLSQGRSAYPAEQQMLIHQGKVLKDDTTLDANKVYENGFIVVMLNKTKGSSSGASTTTATLPPIINSFEIYYSNGLSGPSTDESNGKEMHCVNCTCI